MAKSRALIITKLALLIGLPVAAIAGLFGFGVYWGDAHRTTVLELERDWLKMDVEVPASTGTPDAGATGATGATGAKKPPLGGLLGASGSEAATGAHAPTGSPPAATGATGTAAATGTAPTPPSPDAGTPAPSESSIHYPVAAAPQIPGDLRSAYARARSLSVKVLVDHAYVQAHPEWMRDVEDLVSGASRSYSTLFGVQLSVYGVVQWDVPAQGFTAEQLHADLETRPREGADLLLGITGRPVGPERHNGWSKRPEDERRINSAYSVVFDDPAKPGLTYRALLHEFAHLFGAVDASDANSEAWRAGSFMSYASVPADAAPFIDEDNLRRVLQRKTLPIESEAQVGAGVGSPDFETYVEGSDSL